MKDYGAYVDALGAEPKSPLHDRAMREAALRQQEITKARGQETGEYLNAPTNPSTPADEFARKKMQQILEIRRSRG